MNEIANNFQISYERLLLEFYALEVENKQLKRDILFYKAVIGENNEKETLGEETVPREAGKEDS
jgi:hypothetical protein